MPRFGGSASRGFGASGGFPGGRGSAVAILDYAAQERVMAQYLYEHAGVPTDGTNGTYAHIAPPGALLIDTDAKTLYQNTNTQASPTWTERSASGGGSGETVVYSHTATGSESTFGPITLPADGRHAEVLITAGGNVAGFAFAFVLNGDVDPSHYSGDGVPGAISREFDGIVGNANAVCQVQMLCADYRRVGWHLLPRHTSLMDGNTAFHQKDVGAYLVELALSNLTLLTYANDGVFDPTPLASGSRVEVRIRS